MVVVVAVTLGLFGGLFGSAMIQGTSDQRVKDALTQEVSHIQLHNPRFTENPELGFTIDHPDQIIQFIEKQPGVQAAAHRIKLTSMINSSSSNAGITLLGIDPEKEKRVTEIYLALYDSSKVAEERSLTDPEQISNFLKDSVGQYFEGVQSNPILIGEQLAEKLKIKVRSKIVLTFQGLDGSLHGGAFRVCGIFRTANSLFEESNAFVSASDLTRLLGGNEQLCHEIAVFMDDTRQMSGLENILKTTYPVLEVSNWKELQPDVAMLNDLMAVSVFIVMVIILLALGFGIVNTMLMVVLERVKELGLLMAIGMNKARVFMMIVLESVLLSLTGAAAGMGISVITIQILGARGLDLSIFVEEGFEALGLAAVFYPRLDFQYYLMVTLMVIIAAVLASIYPALKALKLNPADALRSE